MRWLAWRQLRTPAIVTVGLLAVLSAFLVYLGLDLRAFVDDRITGCGDPQTCELAREALRAKFHTPVTLTSGLLLFTPALLGAFWGAPLIAREGETGTHRLVWTQSVTRTHWLAVKLTVLMVAGLAVSAAFAWLLTWAAAPYDDEVSSRFASFTFGARGLVPLGYVALGLAVGVAAGLAVRKTLPALAITLAVMAVVQVAMPLFVRPHLLPSVTQHVAVDVVAMGRLGGLYIQGDRLVAENYVMPGGWVLTGASTIQDAAGTPVSPSVTKPCMDVTASPTEASGCLERLDLHFDINYQPAGRYWPFQGIETGAMVALALALVAWCRWRIPRGIP